MNKKSLRAVLCFSLVTAFAFPSFAIVGIGAHYGYDMSLSMEDVTGEQAAFNDLKLDVANFTGTKPPGFTQTTITGKDLPITINRINFERHAFNMGGKVYIDIIPFINALELSANYGMWQYEGMIKYPTAIAFKSSQPSDPNAPFIDRVDITYDSTMVTLEDLGLDNPFLKKTPYAKLNIDLTVRKYIVKFPPALNIVRLYGGAGTSINFATPILSAGFIEKTLSSTLSSNTNVGNLQSAVFGQNSTAMQTLGKEFMKKLFTPHWGAHLDLGAMIKIPLIPIGIYVDGKYMIPFGQLDDNVKELKSSGILINMGLAFAL